ncbi:adenylosuccinate lyase [Spirochaetota bacterium]|nr:adenylosuccinate lyase [Spirochaetota bacterium]
MGKTPNTTSINRLDKKASRKAKTTRAESYRSPLELRYASDEMLYLFSAEAKAKTWRQLWLYLAEGQKKYGLPIKPEAIRQMRQNVGEIDFSRVEHYETKFRHEVMAHIYAFGEVAPAASGIMHLGATSVYVIDNTDIIEMRTALLLIKKKVINIIENLKAQAKRYKNLPTLGYTHFQPAQITTVGKRFTLYIQELLLDLEEVDYIIETLPFRGIKGATGTQASFLTLFAKGRSAEEKTKASNTVQKLDEWIAQKCGFKKDRLLIVTGQTSSRKLDYRIASWLSSVAQTASKFATDLRLLQHKKEIEEPFEKDQIGSSAMPYKRNPMRSERICSLARFIMSLPNTFAYTASTQWLERTLDDSANRRISMPEAFLATDGMLELMRNITGNLVIYPEMIDKNLQLELPIIVLETLMLRHIRKKGANRQKLHETTREIAMTLHEKIKYQTLDHPHEPLLDLKPKLMEKYNLTEAELTYFINPNNLMGRSEEQVDAFIKKLQKCLAASKNQFKSYEKHFKFYGEKLSIKSFDKKAPKIKV